MATRKITVENPDLPHSKPLESGDTADVGGPLTATTLTTTGAATIGGALTASGGVSGGGIVEELTATAAVTAGVGSVELNHASTVIAATIASSVNHPGLFVVKNTSASGTAAHTLTLTAGTFNGTNNVATLNAPGECLVVYFDSAGNGIVVENVGTVGLS